MAMHRTLVCFIFAVFVVYEANAADILNCYKCTSLTNPKCGATWGYKSASSVPAEAKTTCEGKNAACKKIVSNDGPEGVEFVIRDCFNSTEGIDSDFLSCHDMMKAGDLCYCNEDNCNGQGHIAASGILATVALIVSWVASL